MNERHVVAASVAGALALHAALLLGTDGVWGGADLKPHLRLIQWMAEEPGIRSVYAPAYHGLGALLAPLVSLAAYPEWFAWLSLAALIAGFRAFQRAAGLPDLATALFAWSPYHFALTTCLPKVEAAGYALTLLGLALLLRKRHVALGLCLAATFFVHTAAALLLGLAGGVLALTLGDRRALGALAVGTLLAAPLPLTHLAAGCTLPQALLFSQGDYLRPAPRLANLEQWHRIVLLANPVLAIAAGFGASRLWRVHRPAGVVALLLVVLYANELWLAPLGARTTLDLVRGLTVLAIPLALAAGVALAPRPRAAIAALLASVAIAASALAFVVPNVCVSRPIDMAEIASFSVDRCQFRWRKARPSRARVGAQPAQVAPDRRVVGPADAERTAQ